MDTFLKPIRIAEQTSTPSTLPPSGYQFVYPKTDGKMYALNASGVETEVTNAGAGGISDGPKAEITIKNAGASYLMNKGLITMIARGICL